MAADRGRWLSGKFMVATGVSRKAYQGNLGEYLTGVWDKAEWEGHAVGGVSRYIGGRWARGWIVWDG